MYFHKLYHDLLNNGCKVDKCILDNYNGCFFLKKTKHCQWYLAVVFTRPVYGDDPPVNRIEQNLHSRTNNNVCL